MRGQRESTERYLMQCRPPSLPYALHCPVRCTPFVPSLSSVRSQVSQLGLLYGKGSWAVLSETGQIKGWLYFPAISNIPNVFLIRHRVDIDIV